MRVNIYSNLDSKSLIPSQEYIIEEEIGYKTGNPIYKLVRVGGSWTQDYIDTVAIEVEDTGEGYKFSVVKKHMNYAETAELYIMLRFLDLLGKQNGSQDGIFAGQIEIIKDSIVGYI